MRRTTSDHVRLVMAVSALLLVQKSFSQLDSVLYAPIPEQHRDPSERYVPWQGEDAWENITVDEQAQFPGGEEARARFITANVRYPANIGTVSGKVYVEYVIEKDGRIGPARVLRGFIPALDEEAVRVVKLLPKHAPAKVNGAAVRVTYRIPVSFKSE